MAQEPEIQTEADWYGDETEMETAMSDDDFDFDEVLDLDEGEEVLEKEERPGGNVPVWRLIEMSRENRFLREELADFDDYEVDGYGTEYAH